MAARNPKPENQHFFKPLLPGFQHKLAIPESFYVKYLKDERVEKVALRTPMAKHWHVKLHGKVIFGDGWEKFCEEEELQVGYFLVFGLVEVADVVGLVFDVLVFDLTTCTRDYPCLRQVTEETPEEGEIRHESAGEHRKKEKDTNFGQKLDSFVPRHPHFRSGNKPVVKLTKCPDGFKPNPKTNKQPSNNATRDQVCSSSRNPFGNFRQKENDENFEQKAGPYVPQHPYFELNVSSYSAKSSILCIPTNFARENGLYNRSCDIVLVNERGKEWLAGLGFYPERNLVHIKRTWIAFRSANSLKAGDSCIFELIQNGEKPVLKLTRSPKGFKPSPKAEKQPTDKALPDRAGFWSKMPYVYVTVKPYHFKLCLLRIPTAFAVNTGFERTLPEEVVIRNEREQQWTVSTWRSKTGSINLGHGWIAFARSNGIKVGDVLKLELIENGKNPIVRISGVTRNNKNYDKINRKNSSKTREESTI